MSAETPRETPRWRGESWVTRACAVVVAGVAAYSSYGHQRDFALDGGADPISAALWPLSVDGLVILASLGLLQPRTETSRRARCAVWFAFLLGVVVSLAANIAAAPELSWQPVVVAGWPPLALLLATELILHSRRLVETPHSDSASPGTTKPPVAETAREPGTAVDAGTAAETANEAETTDEDGTADVAAAHATDAEDGLAAARRARSRSSARSSRPRQVVSRLDADTSGRAGSRAEDLMWDHYQRAMARGHAPTGAELDRVAGTSNYGRRVVARWRDSGRLPPAA